MTEWTPAYAVWCRREVIVRRLECNALETALLFHEQMREPPKPVSPRVAEEARRILVLAERLRNDPARVQGRYAALAGSIVEDAERLAKTTARTAMSAILVGALAVLRRYVDVNVDTGAL